MEPRNNNTCPPYIAEYLKEAKECTICMDEFKEDTFAAKVYKTACNHFFHTDCLSEWVKNNATCPVCRKAVDFKKNMANWQKELTTAKKQYEGQVAILAKIQQGVTADQNKKRKREDDDAALARKLQKQFDAEKPRTPVDRNQEINRLVAKLDAILKKATLGTNVSDQIKSKIASGDFSAALEQLETLRAVLQVDGSAQDIKTVDEVMQILKEGIARRKTEPGNDPLFSSLQELAINILQNGIGHFSAKDKAAEKLCTQATESILNGETSTGALLTIKAAMVVCAQAKLLTAKQEEQFRQFVKLLELRSHT